MINNILETKKHSKKAFTIVELLIVIVIIGILSGVVVAAYNGIQNRARTAKMRSVALEIRDKAAAFYAETSFYPGSGRLKNPYDEYINQDPVIGHAAAKEASGATKIDSAVLSKQARAALVDALTASDYFSRSEESMTEEMRAKHHEVVGMGSCSENEIGWRSQYGPDASGVFLTYYDYSAKKISRDIIYLGNCTKKQRDEIKGQYLK